MQESELHSHIFREARDLSRLFPRVERGPGDDCAVLRVGSELLLATVDHLIEHRHFQTGTPIDAVARKAIARSVSDIAAMAGAPIGTLVAAALPHGYPQRDAEALYDRLAYWGRHFACPLVGGDAATFGQGDAAGPLSLAVTVLGVAHGVRGPVLRSGAVAGDGVYVTGRLGGSLASGRHVSFEPRTREATWLADTLGARLHAMMDLSDGLGRDAGRMAAASAARIELREAALPINDGCGAFGALSDGEDYELLFTAAAPVPEQCPGGVSIARVGEVVAGAGCVVFPVRGEAFDVSSLGWEHQ